MPSPSGTARIRKIVPPRTLFQSVLPAILVVLFPFILMDAFTSAHTVQAGANLEVMNSDDLWGGLLNYPKVWPPLYPALLWILHKLTMLSAHAINIVFFSAALILVCVFTRQYIANRFFLLPAVLMVINTAFYYNAKVISSEILMQAQALLLILILAAHCRSPQYKYAVWLGFLTGIMCYTRYFGLIWVFPTTVFCLMLTNTSVRAKINQILVYSSVSFGISASWVLYIFSTTGYFTGMDRTGEREDLAASGMEFMAEFTNFGQNLVGTLKTATLDLFSPFVVGEISSILFKKLSAYEIFLAIILLIVFVLTLTHIFQLARTGVAGKNLSPVLIPAIFCLSYIALTILVWTFGNNDPIFTRFMFPVYPFLILAAFALFVDSKGKKGAHIMVRYFLTGAAIVYVANGLLDMTSLLRNLSA